LVFDGGSFSEDATFLVGEMFLRNPKEVLSKNLQTPIRAFDNIPPGQLYILMEPLHPSTFPIRQ
jgi:hypothetical protein